MNQDHPEISDLNERDINILHVLIEENLTHFTFEGLKRRLQMHPETLSRILYRLTNQDILKKNKKDYSLPSTTKKLLNKKPNNSPTSNLKLLQTFLPPEISIKTLISNLSGKWFGNLRWLGYSETSEGAYLKWITTNGGTIISAMFSQDELIIEAKIITEIQHNVALSASTQLLSHITKLISRTNNN